MNTGPSGFKPLIGLERMDDVYLEGKSECRNKHTLTQGPCEQRCRKGFLKPRESRLLSYAPFGCCLVAKLYPTRLQPHGL